MQDDVGEIVRAVVTAARNGDMTAAKINLDRIAPVRRSISFDLPRIEGWANVGAARAPILEAVADGNLMPSEAADIFKLVEKVARLREAAAARGASPGLEP